MGYKHTNSRGITYFLNTKQVQLNGGSAHPIFYFSKDERETNCELPADREVSENPTSGMLVLRKKV